MPSRSRILRMSRSFVVLVLAGAPAFAQATQRMVVHMDGAPAVGRSYYPSISPDGRYVTFESEDPELVPGDTNHWADVFLRDRWLGTTERVSVSSAGVQGNYPSDSRSAVSADGRYVAFESFASNLVAGDTNGTYDIFVRDRQAGTTELASISMNGGSGNGESTNPSFSADGRFVAFQSSATDIAPGGMMLLTQIFVRDRQTGTTRNATWIGLGGFVGGSYGGALSADGRYMAFAAPTSFLVLGDTNNCEDVFVRDLLIGGIERMSVSSGGVQGDRSSGGGSISADGMLVAFESDATNLVAVDANGVRDVFVRDRLAGTTVCASATPAGLPGNGASGFSEISPDGRFVVFQSEATDLVDGSANGVGHVFLRDLETGRTELVDVGYLGGPANSWSGNPAVSSDGQVTVFETASTNLLPAGRGPVVEIYARDLLGGSYPWNFCDPNSPGVIPCPCGNQPIRQGRGCDNSARTGGARLAVSGGAYVTSDSVVFSTSDELPGAASFLLQGTRILATGVVYGQGLRCARGTLTRLFTRAASGGRVTLPDFTAGDPPITVRSASKGDPIGVGAQRTYLVAYRDPIVLGGCPATATFNATQTINLPWYP